MNHIPKIIIKPIDGENQTYPTVGNYTYDAEDKVLRIFVSRMNDWRSEAAVAVHEFIEALACIDKEISMSSIDLFDMQYEKERDEGKHGELEEPGDDKNAPYHRQHIAATFVEQTVCSQLELDWKTHESNVYEA
jgi:hypothetical protein